MPHEATAPAGPAPRLAGDGERRRGFALLARAAAPEKRQLARAALGMSVAGLLESVGPI